MKTVYLISMYDSEGTCYDFEDGFRSLEDAKERAYEYADSIHDTAGKDWHGLIDVEIGTVHEDFEDYETVTVIDF